MDKSRLALCMVLFTVVLMNPLSPALQDADTYTVEGGAGGRSILGTEAATGLTQLMRASSSSLLVSAFNIIILIMGKPAGKPTSQPWIRDPSDCVCQVSSGYLCMESPGSARERAGAGGGK